MSLSKAQRLAHEVRQAQLVMHEASAAVEKDRAWDGSGTDHADWERRDTHRYNVRRNHQASVEAYERCLQTLLAFLGAG